MEGSSHPPLNPDLLEIQECSPGLGLGLVPEHQRCYHREVDWYRSTLPLVLGLAVYQNLSDCAFAAPVGWLVQL